MPRQHNRRILQRRRTAEHARLDAAARHGVHGRQRTDRRRAAHPHLARPLQQGGRRRGDPLRRQQARLLPGRRTPAAIHGLLLRRLAVQLSDQPRGSEQEPRRSAPTGRCRVARCCRPTPAATTRCCSPARPANGRATPARSCSAARSDSAADGQELARVHDPGGIELGLEGAQRRQAGAADLLAPSTARGRARRRDGG